MTWTKLGSEYLTDPEMLGLPRGARLLHIEATIWSNQHGTDGRIPRHILTRISDEPDPEGAAGHLVNAGKWVAVPDGWTLGDFLNNQPSAADVDRTTNLAKERQRRQRQHRGGDHSLCNPRYCREASTRDFPRDTARDSAVSHETRTAPSRTDPSRKGEVSCTGGADGSTADAVARRPAEVRKVGPDRWIVE